MSFSDISAGRQITLIAPTALCSPAWGFPHLEKKIGTNFLPAESKGFIRYFRCRELTAPVAQWNWSDIFVPADRIRDEPGTEEKKVHPKLTFWSSKNKRQINRMCNLKGIMGKTKGETKNGKIRHFCRYGDINQACAGENRRLHGLFWRKKPWGDPQNRAFQHFCHVPDRSAQAKQRPLARGRHSTRPQSVSPLREPLCRMPPTVPWKWVAVDRS